MRRLLVITLILTGVLSGAIRLGSIAGSADIDHPGCLIFFKEGNMVVYDSKTSASTIMPEFYLRALSLDIGRADKRYSLFAKPFVSNINKLYLKDTQGLYRYLHDVSRPMGVFLSPDGKKLGILSVFLKQKPEQTSMNVTFLESFQTFTFPARQMPDTEWSADSKYLYTPGQLFNADTGSVSNVDFSSFIWAKNGNLLAAIENKPQNNDGKFTLVAMNGDGSNQQKFILEADLRENVVVMGISSNDRYVLVHHGIKFIFVDIVSGDIWTPNGDFWHRSIHALLGKNAFLAYLGNSGTPSFPVILDPEEQSVTRLFTDPTVQIVDINEQAILFSTPNTNETKNFYRMNIEGNDLRLIARNLTAPKLITGWHVKPYVVVAAKQNGKNVLVVDDFNDETLMFTQSFSGTQMEIRKFQFYMSSENPWIAVNFGDGSNLHAKMINISTREIRDFGEGQFEEPGIFKFDLVDGLVFRRTTQDGKIEYQIFNPKAELIAQFTLTVQQSEKWKTLSPDHSKLLIREISDGQITRLWTVESNSASASLLMEQSLFSGKWRDEIEWTIDSKHIALVRRNQDFSRIQSYGSIMIYDIDGKLIRSSPISNSLIGGGFPTISCRLDNLPRSPESDLFVVN